MAETKALDEGRLVMLLGKVEHMLHDEYHRQWDEAKGEKPEEPKATSAERLGQLLDIMFPGEKVTVTNEAGDTLVGPEEEEEAKEGDGDEETEG